MKKSAIMKRIISSLVVIAELCSVIAVFPAIPSFAEKGSEESHLILRYTFDDENNPAYDSIGNNHGTVKGNVVSCEGVSGKGVRFDSKDHQNNEAYIRIPADIFKQKELTLSVYARFDPETVGAYSRIFAIESSSSTKTFHLMTNPGSQTGGYKAELFGGNPSSASVCTDNILSIDKLMDWHLITMTYDGQIVRLFADGKLMNSTAVVTDLSSWKIVNAFLGKTAIWNDGTYNGEMDDFRIYDKALTEEEIEREYELDGSNISLKNRCLLSSLSADGTPFSEFSVYQNEYYRVLTSDDIPVIEATAPYEGASVSVKQAETIPGSASVTVTYKDGLSSKVIVHFVKKEDSEIKMPDLSDVSIDDPFWNDRLNKFASVTAKYVLTQWCNQTHGNLTNFKKVAAGHRNTKDYTGSMTWGESDFYASIAGACRLMRKYPDDSVMNQINSIATTICEAAETCDDGYFSVYNLLMTDGKVFSEASNPESVMDLFCLGYLLEAGIAYYELTGNARLLRAGVRFLNFTVGFSNHGEKNFISFHNGVEYNIIALCEFLENHAELYENPYLSDLTMNIPDYVELSENLIRFKGNHDNRVGGKDYGSYSNDHMSYEQLNTASGHSVVALLYYFGISETARATDDISYLNAAYRLWEDITERQMYVTGAVGSVSSYEGFGGDYNLPNTGYCESCTSGALLQLSESLSQSIMDSSFADNVELQLYNTLLGSIGDDGISFFYQNPLYSGNTSRWSWHGVPCCTKYGLLVYGNLPKYIYSYQDNDLFVNQYIGSNATIRLKNGDLILEQNADYAINGTSSITVVSGSENMRVLYLRLPEWSTTTKIFVNGSEINYSVKNGYASLEGISDGDVISLSFDMSVKRVYANENVKFDKDRVAVKRGPVLYCMESVDNSIEGVGEYVSYAVLPVDSGFTEKNIDLCGGVISICANGLIATKKGETSDALLTFIPFFARANRGSSAISVFIPEKEELITEYPFAIDETRKELKSLGAEYFPSTNAINPKGGGSYDISVITDGETGYSNDKRQYDTFNATYTDDLGKSGVIWFGVTFEGEYKISDIVFWEGGHWNDGGWFGESPYVQILQNGEWKDVGFTLNREYKKDSLEAQMPTNESWVFSLSEETPAEGVRVLGKKNRLAGHASCAEIEIYGESIHKFEKHPGKASTCETEGYKPYVTCLDCDYKKIETLPLENHKFGSWSVKVSGTCITKGTNQRICSVCGYEETKESAFSKNNHAGGTEIKNAVEATTEKEGYTGDTYCKGCGIKLSEGTIIEKLPETIETGSNVTEPSPVVTEPSQIVTQAPVSEETADTTDSKETSAPVTTEKSESKKKGCFSSSGIFGPCVIAALSAAFASLIKKKKRK